MSQPREVQPSGRRLLGGTVTLLAVRVAGLVMGLVVSVLLARGLGVQALGTFATGLALVHIGSMLTDFGMSALLVREGADAPTLRAAMLRWATRARMVSGLIVFVLLSLVALALVEDSGSRLSVVLLLASVPLTSFTLGTTLLQQRLMLNRMALLLLTQSVLWLAMVATLFMRGAGLRAYAIAFVIYNAAYGLLVYVVSRRALTGPAETMSLRHFTRLMRDVIPLSITVLLVTLYYKLDSLFVYQFAGAAAAGSYAIAYRFLDQLQIIPVTLGNLFLPLLTRRKNSGEPTQPMFDRYVRITLLLATPVTGLGMVLARPLVALFGRDYVDAVLLLRLLLPTFVIVAFSYVVVHVSIVHRQAKKQLLAACVGLAINVALNLIFVPIYGARAAAVASLLTELTVVATLYLSVRRPCALQLPWRWSIRLMGALALSSLAAAVLHTNPYGAAVAFTVVYAVGVAALDVVDVDEIRALLRRPPAPIPASLVPATPVPASADAVEEPTDLGTEVRVPEH